MRINEIVVTNYPEKPSELSYNDLTSGEHDKKHGGYSYADDTDMDPHEIMIKNISNRVVDPKTVFYTQLADLMGANPYMPVVYNVDQYGEDKPRFEFKTQRLVDFETIDPVAFIRAITLFVEDLKHNTPGKKKLVDYINQYQTAQSDDLKKSIQTQTSDIIKKQSYNPTGLPNTALKEFLTRLNKIIDHKNIVRDFSPNNLMFRLTSFGAQLVISDPVAHNTFNR